MLKFTQDEKDAVTDYYLSQSKDASVIFTQKVYSESIIGHNHDVWDLHASDGRWWIITNPTNLYSQEQFPNLDLAVTFHMGLCLRIPRGGRKSPAVATLRPFSEVLQAISDCDDALAQANDAGAYRAIGVRCRENLLAFIHAAQDAADWLADKPQRSNFIEWTDLISDTIQAGSENRERRRLLKSALKEAWAYVNWLTHSQSGNWIDAEMATTAVSHALGMATSMTIRHIRGVPDQCPECQSPNLNPEEGLHTDYPEVVFERPVCADCGWAGDAVPIGERSDEEMEEYITRQGETEDQCGIMSSPLVRLTRPGKN